MPNNDSTKRAQSQSQTMAAYRRQDARREAFEFACSYQSFAHKNRQKVYHCWRGMFRIHVQAYIWSSDFDFFLIGRVSWSLDCNEAIGAW